MATKILRFVVRLYLGFMKVVAPFTLLLALFGLLGDLLQLTCIIFLSGVITIALFKKNELSP